MVRATNMEAHTCWLRIAILFVVCLKDTTHCTPDSKDRNRLPISNLNTNSSPIEKSAIRQHSLSSSQYVQERLGILPFNSQKLPPQLEQFPKPMETTTELSETLNEEAEILEENMQTFIAAREKSSSNFSKEETNDLKITSPGKINSKLEKMGNIREVDISNAKNLVRRKWHFITTNRKSLDHSPDPKYNPNPYPIHNHDSNIDLKKPQSDQDIVEINQRHIYKQNVEKRIELSARPMSITVGETETFSVTCSTDPNPNPNPADQRGQALQYKPLSLEIDKHDGQSRRRLAVLSAIHGAMPIRDQLTENAHISGSVPDQGEPWVMTITWTNPTAALGGTYVCKLTAMGNDTLMEDFAYDKIQVEIKESPGVRLSERIFVTEQRIEQLMKDREKNDNIQSILRSLLFNVTKILVDTTTYCIEMKKKINLQAVAYIKVRQDLMTAISKDEEIKAHLNATEDSMASTLNVQAKAMGLLHQQSRHFAAGLQSLKQHMSNIEEQLSHEKQSLNDRLDSQRYSLAQLRDTFQEFQESKSLSDNKFDELGLTDGSIRLIHNGTIGREGRLEIFHGGQWGTVCDDHFDEKAALVVCHQLGFNTNKPTFNGNAYYGAGNHMPIHLDDVTCEGTETALVKCSHGIWGFHGCTHDEDVGVKC
ncbi:uncharacterized protein LOC131949396 isoform X2 [Physella acuta]|uniref:uncharacterized protein LOC131949396 isoform X2 n=1 Tax=Physella acuta TaxID=109671 RepID=UPI0027DDD56E|nr:uncharacterized protein LOC131949396 isoform X2 [Physella acuta]